MARDEARRPSWLERRKAAKRAKAERTGDSPEKRAAHQRKTGDSDVKDAAAGAGIAGSLSGGF